MHRWIHIHEDKTWEIGGDSSGEKNLEYFSPRWNHLTPPPSFQNEGSISEANPPRGCALDRLESLDMMTTPAGQFLNSIVRLIVLGGRKS